MELALSFALEFEVLQESTEPLSPFNGLNLYMPVQRESLGMRLYASVNCRLCSSVIKSVTRCSGGRGEAVVTTYYACVNWNEMGENREQRTEQSGRASYTYSFT